MNKRFKKILIIGGVLIVLLMVLVILKNNTSFMGAPKGNYVELDTVRKRTIIETVSATGKIRPTTEVKISSDVSGEIMMLSIEEGDSVKAGQLLAQIRPDNFRSILDQAKASLNAQKAAFSQAKSRYSQAYANFLRDSLAFARSKKLYEDKVISDADFEQARAAYNVSAQELKAAKENQNAAYYNVSNARARVDEAKDNLERTSIYAPMDGIVSDLKVELGERVVGTMQMTGTEMMRIADFSAMEVRIMVNENDIVNVNVGDKAELEVDAYFASDLKFKGYVSQVANSAEESLSIDQVTEFEVRIAIDPKSYASLVSEDNQQPLKPGMTATAEISTKIKKDVISVPIAAVTTRSLDSAENDDSKSQVVFLFEEGTANIQKVQTGLRDFDFIEITNGIKSGDIIVSGPYTKVSRTLEDGDKVLSKKN